MTPQELGAHAPAFAAADDGGASRPSQRRLGSMIAGRRPASSTSSPSSRSSSSSEPTEERAKPAERAPRTPRASGEASAAADDGKPQVRRRPARSRGRGGDSKTTRGAEPTTDVAETPEVVVEAPAAEPEAVAAPARSTPSRSTSSRQPASGGDADGDLSAIREAVARQEQALAELRATIEGVGERITMSGYRPRVAVFVDVPNLIYGYEGDGFLNMGRLLSLITDGRDLVRATAYSPVSDDPREPVEQQRFVAPFVAHEYRIVTKPLKRFSDGSIKGNFDVEMAVDMVLMADRVDIISIVSGDSDFARAVEVVQQKGVRVEVVAFAGSTSIEMRALADRYMELDRVVKQIL